MTVGDSVREVPEFARRMLAAFTASGAEFLTVAQLVEHLAVAEPERWHQWDDRPDRLRLSMAGTEIRRELAAAGLDVPTARPTGSATGYRLADLEAALSAEE